MFTASFRRKTLPECVFLCIRSSVSVYVTTVWTPTIDYLCLFLEGGAPETWLPLVIGWRLRCEKFTLEGALCWIFFFFFACN